MDGLGFRQLMCGRSCSCNGQSSTWARSIALPRSNEEISQPEKKARSNSPRSTPSVNTKFLNDSLSFGCHQLSLRIIEERLNSSEVLCTIKDDVIRVHHGQEVPEWHVDLAFQAWAQTNRGRLQKGAVVICFLGMKQHIKFRCVALKFNLLNQRKLSSL